MNRPSNNWLNLRRATLDRASRAVLAPLEPLSTIYALVCTFYVVGALRLQFFDHTVTFNAIEAIQVVSVATAGVLVPILTGSVIALHFTSRKLEKLASEHGSN